MKPFTKRLALVMGLLFTALLCLGVVFIDTVKNFWNVSGGFVQLVVNTNAQASITVDTNGMFVGINTNNQLYSFLAQGRTPAAAVTGNGATAANSGSVRSVAGNGGDASTNSLAASGGVGGGIVLSAGVGGSALSSVSNSTAGAGGVAQVLSGVGGGGSSVATNIITGGAGGTLTFAGGAGGAPSMAATQTLGGAGAALNFTAGAGGLPSAGWLRRPGAGGVINFTAGSGGTPATRTNGATGGSINMTAGAAGNSATTPGTAGAPGEVNITAGAGATGDTNSNGGNVFISGGAQGSGAVPGNVVIGRILAGTSRGGLQVGPALTSSATLTNWLSATQALSFGELAAGTALDLPITVTGAAAGDVVILGVPLESVTNLMWLGFASNNTVYVRAQNGQLVTSQTANAGNFRVSVLKFR